MIQSYITNREVTLIQKANTAVICLSPYQGGMELDALHLSKLLSSISNITLIAKEDKFIATTYATQDNHHNIALETIDFKGSMSFSIISHVRRIIKEKKIENVLFLGASELKSLYFAFLGLEINLIIRHGTTKSTPKKDWFHKLIYSNVNYHITICEHLARNVKYIIPFGKKTQLKVIYPSLNLTPSQTIDYVAKPHQPLQILHVGRIAAGKGQKAAIAACEVLYKHNIDFIFNIVGGYHEPYKHEFETYLDTLKYKEKINLVGHTNKVEHYYLKGDIFLFPSDGEGLSNAFIEAMLYGLTAISYDNTSFPELQELGFSFSIVEDQNIEKLKETLLTVTLNYNDQLQLNPNNAKLSKELFNEQLEVTQFKNLLL